MGASIYWKPVKPTKSYQLGTWAPQDFMSKMEDAFGSNTPTLNKSDIPTLRGMAIMWGDDEREQKNPYRELMVAIDKYGEIELEVEY